MEEVVSRSSRAVSVVKSCLLQLGDIFGQFPKEDGGIGMDKILLNKIGRKLKDFQEELQNAIEEQPETSCEQLNAEWEKLMEEKIMTKTKEKWWFNIYRGTDIEGEYYFIDGPWRTKECAFGYVDEEQEYINTIRIEKEEE